VSRLSFLKRRQNLGVAAAILGASVLLSRVMGLVRDKVISFLFGAAGESDLYFAAFVIPDFINYLLAGAYFSITLIPLLTAAFDRDREDGWRFFSAVFTWVGIAITVLTAAAIVWAPVLARVAAPGLAPERLLRLALFLRIVLPAQVFFLLGSCLTAVLFLRKQFLVPALTPLIYNGLIIVGGVLLQDRGMEGFCWGVLAGAFLGNFALPYLAVRYGDGLPLRLRLWHPGLKRFGLLALPLMLGQSVVVLDEQLLRIFGSLAGTGAISWLSYARRLMMVPVGVVAQAAGVASYPFLAELVAKREFGRLHDTLNTALRNLLTLLVPVSVWMMVVSEPVVRLIFQQGRFGPADTRQTALMLQILLTVVCCWGMHQLVSRAFYARQDTLSPAVIGTLATLCCVPLFWLLGRHLHAPGVAMASAVAVALYTGILCWWWGRRFGGGAFAGLAAAGLKLALLSLVAAAPALLVVRFERAFHRGHLYLGAAVAIVAAGVAFGLPFVLLGSRFVPALVRPYLERSGRLGRWLERTPTA
jgi:putative peptidoglycan lipid II flippase